MRLNSLKKWSVGLVVALGLCQAHNASADAVSGQVKFINYSGRGGDYGGGEFKFEAWQNATGIPVLGGGTTSSTSLSSVQRSAGNQFLTFCLEETENISSGSIYVGTLNGTSSAAGRAFKGGATTDGTPGSYDPISVKTAYIFQNYENGFLTTNTSGYTATDIGDAVQLAIWYLEEENTLTGHGSRDTLANALITEATNAINTNATVGNVLWGANKFNDVRVLNIVDGAGVLSQSQLVLATANADVPLPGVATMGLASFGSLAGLRFIRRRHA